jgi:magnesium transporter
LSSLPARDEDPARATPLAEAGKSDLVASLYDANRTDRHISLKDVAIKRLNVEQLLWIDVSSEDQIAAVATAVGLAAETVDAIRGGSSQPALFLHDSYAHVVVVAPGNATAFHTPHVIHCLVGPNWVLTIHREPIQFLGIFGERIRGDSELGKLDAHGFLAAILHEHVASYLTELRPIEAGLDQIDLLTMTGRIGEEALLRELVETRLRLARLRRMLEPHRELFSLLARSEFTVLSGSQAASDFEALSELLERTLQSMEATREMIIGSFEIYTTWTAHGTNKVIKRLTFVSVTLLPPTLLAGVMGMNSLPNALISGGAFWASMVAMGTLVLTIPTLARLRGWI